MTKSVEIPLEARLEGGVITVAGSLPIQFADYDIGPPQGMIVLSVEDHGDAGAAAALRARLISGSSQGPAFNQHRRGAPGGLLPTESAAIFVSRERRAAQAPLTEVTRIGTWPPLARRHRRPCMPLPRRWGVRQFDVTALLVANGVFIVLIGSATAGSTARHAAGAFTAAGQ